ncbi:TPA: type III-A CRISPR-associated RAMP protein Csm4 [Candidatus Poribacteria bacterium]|nr:type III-A CRISPR-associated RAMP protein Csm4 [Candidatus Poribacteria bacterium]
MQLPIYKLHPKSAFHFGERGVGLERTAVVFHSDSLFSAIVCAWRGLGMPVSSDGTMPLLAPFATALKCPLFLSSAFPFAFDILFLPRPLNREGKGPKSFAEFVSLAVFQEIVQGRESRDQWHAVQGGEALVTTDEALFLLRRLKGQRKRPQRLTESEFFSLRQEEIVALRTNQKKELLQRFNTRQLELWASGEDTRVPRAAVDRISSASTLYFCGRLHFAQGCGLYFWADIRQDGYDEHLLSALDFLSEEGIGGERTTHGRFELECATAELPEAKTQNGDETMFLTLSLYHPTKEEVCNQKVLVEGCYDIIERRGWVYSPDGLGFRHKGIRMFLEGSIFFSPILGDISEVQPDRFPHPIYRYGFAFPPHGLKVNLSDELSKQEGELFEPRE